MPMLTPDAFVANALRNPVNATLLARLRALQLNDCFLAAGCVFQATWNLRPGRPADWGVKDYDVFYFDDRDLSWEAEDAVIARVQAQVADLGVQVEVKNQARVPGAVALAVDRPVAGVRPRVPWPRSACAMPPSPSPAHGGRRRTGAWRR